MTTPTKRFCVFTWGAPTFDGATYDEVHSRILQHHAARLKACGFRIDFSVAHYDPGDPIPYGGGYAIVDNHAEAA